MKLNLTTLLPAVKLVIIDVAKIRGNPALLAQLVTLIVMLAGLLRVNTSTAAVMGALTMITFMASVLEKSFNLNTPVTK